MSRDAGLLKNRDLRGNKTLGNSVYRLSPAQPVPHVEQEVGLFGA